HSQLIADVIASAGAPETPDRSLAAPWTISVFTAASTSLQDEAAAGNWTRAAAMSLHVLAIYLFSYQRFHPLVSLQWVMAGKILWNAAGDVDDLPTRRAMCGDARVCLRKGMEALLVSHGGEGEGRALVDDVMNVLKDIDLEGW
ncbi:hypothetical protein BDK51DRAFT_33682, partial [Blyttiomyces helicus]